MENKKILFQIDLDNQIFNNLDLDNIEDLDLCINELSVGSTNFSGKVGICSIWVYSNEGSIPHFHIENDKFSCCVKIFEADYFSHGYHKDKLYNAKQKKILDNFLRTNASGTNKSKWEIIKNEWVRSANKYSVPHDIENIKQPDYTKLP